MAPVAMLNRYLVIVVLAIGLWAGQATATRTSSQRLALRNRQLLNTAAEGNTTHSEELVPEGLQANCSTCPTIPSSSATPLSPEPGVPTFPSTSTSLLAPKTPQPPARSPKKPPPRRSPRPPPRQPPKPLRSPSPPKSLRPPPKRSPPPVAKGEMVCGIVRVTSSKTSLYQSFPSSSTAAVMAHSLTDAANTNGLKVVTPFTQEKCKSTQNLTPDSFACVCGEVSPAEDVSALQPLAKDITGTWYKVTLATLFDGWYTVNTVSCPPPGVRVAVLLWSGDGAQNSGLFYYNSLICSGF